MDYKQAVKDKETEYSELYERMKVDEDMLYLAKYEMLDARKKAVKDIINVTLNRPAVFAANVISALGKASEQRVVESEDKNLDTTEIEEFQKAAFASANDRLRRQGRGQLNPFFDTQNCIRGRSAARCVFQMVNDILVPEIMPWDTRYVTYEMGTDGLNWAAYKTKRPNDVIKAQYGEELAKYNIVLVGKETEVLDVWHTEGNEVSIAEQKILEQEHTFGFTPVCIQVVPLGYGAILLGDQRIKYDGESIFFLIRDVEPELNRLASIMQTLNLKVVKGPRQWESKEGQAYKGVPEYDDAMGSGSMTAADMGGGAKPIDYGDAQRSASMAYQMMDKALQEGSLSSIDLGTLQFQLSAVALIEIGEGRDQVFLPRLEAKAMLNEQLAEMFTRQVIEIGGSVELGTPGHKRAFQVSKLGGEYETTYRYYVKSPKIDAGRYTLAAAAGHLIPDKAKRREILQREAPDEDEQQLRWEEAERLSPAIKIRRTIKDLIEMDEDAEAKLLLSELGVSLKQMLAGDISQMPQPEPEEKPKQVVPLLGGGGGAGRGQPKGEE